MIAVDSNIGIAFLETLLATERMPREDLNAHQGELLSRLYQYSLAETDYYRDRPLPPDSLDATSEFWQRQPFITRGQLSDNLDKISARNVPENHGDIRKIGTGGSTGRSVSRYVTALESLARTISFYRALQAWNYNYSYPLILLRTGNFALYFDKEIENSSDRRDWELPAFFGHKGAAGQYFLDIRSSPAEQLAKVVDVAPANINTLPSNILRLGHEARRQNRTATVPIIMSVSEYLAPEIRALAKETFGSRIMDVISSAEAGIIAIECADSGLYHIQSELVLAEIIGANGQPCRTGEIGELVVTPLYNYASPILRYRSGDYVECGPPCSCGRTLPTISRFVGRAEHMFAFPDGRRRLPDVDRVKITELVGHDAWVFVQTGARHAELRVEQREGGRSLEAIRKLLAACTDGCFDVKARLVEDLPLTSGAKRHFTVNEFCPKTPVWASGPHAHETSAT